ncbi:unnamed protein product [Toxocara canis]|uniref:LisH domain-containing protein n=1 Tax=Toxocara canis TaxID=6265 RepID=A0A183UPZ9_TOXCA|nr:unnamed protein product [Toxocara canis]
MTFNGPHLVAQLRGLHSRFMAVFVLVAVYEKDVDNTKKPECAFQRRRHPESGRLEPSSEEGPNGEAVGSVNCSAFQSIGGNAKLTVDTNPVGTMFAQQPKGPPAPRPQQTLTSQSEASAKEKLAGFVYEYLIHNGATKTAESFKGEMLSQNNVAKQVNVGDAPGFLQNWFFLFWDLYSAAPERRDSCEASQEAKAFHEYGFMNTSHGVPPGPAGAPLMNGMHGSHLGPFLWCSLFSLAPAIRYLRERARMCFVSIHREVFGAFYDVIHIRHVHLLIDRYESAEGGQL